MSEHHGSCLCGAVRYVVDGALSGLTACHCTQCRKTSGHFVVAATCSPQGRLCISDEDGALRWFRSSEKARRGFCRHCGSSLFWTHEEEDQVSIMAGTLDTPTGLAINKVLFTEDAGDYYDLS